jgi:hypothetical protein
MDREEGEMAVVEPRATAVREFSSAVRRRRTTSRGLYHHLAKAIATNTRFQALLMMELL